MARLRWPLPALLVWAACWLVYAAAQRAGAPPPWPVVVAVLPGLLAAWPVAHWWRRVMLAGGFPLSLSLLEGGAVPGWVWLVLLLVLVVVYPARAWRDAPLFPTPRGALDGLPAHAPLPHGALGLDAGCGLGDGLIALRRAYPHARWHGIEWSWPLRAVCALRCPWAQVRRGDIWQQPWDGYELVYLFQRPESMARAHDKARREMRAGSWFVSLEFAVPDEEPTATLHLRDGRNVWLYRMPTAAPRSVARGSA